MARLPAGEPAGLLGYAGRPCTGCRCPERPRAASPSCIGSTSARCACSAGRACARGWRARAQSSGCSLVAGKASAACNAWGCTARPGHRIDQSSGQYRPGGAGSWGMAGTGIDGVASAMLSDGTPGKLSPRFAPGGRGGWGSWGMDGKGIAGNASVSPSDGTPGKLTLKRGGWGSCGAEGNGGAGNASVSPMDGKAQWLMRSSPCRCRWWVR